MNTAHSSLATRLKVGIFTALGLLLIVTITMIINNKPYWWRPCQLVHISVEDATGLKSKAPIRSLGIEIGYLKSVDLSESHVTLGICITAPVEVLTSTRAYIRGEGFLGDKFVELKPIKYVGGQSHLDNTGKVIQESHQEMKPGWISRLEREWTLFPNAWADEKPPTKGREIPVGGEGQDVQQLVHKVDDLVNQVSGLADNLKKAINPEELRTTMKQLNHTLENASKTLAPEGGLNQTAQRTLAKLEDAIDQLRDQLTRINKGEGSVGKLLNDPTYADEIRMAVKNINKILNRVSDVRFVVDIGGSYLTAYDGGRGQFNLGIWPRKDRYYLLGISSDSRGRISNMSVTTTAGGQTTTTQTQTVDQTGILFTGMMGKVFYDRIDAAVGVLYGDAALSLSIRLGPQEAEERFQFRNDVYIRNSAGSLDDRVSFVAMPTSNIYIKGGIESLRLFNGRIPFYIGAGISFDDEDIKLLFALK